MRNVRKIDILSRTIGDTLPAHDPDGGGSQRRVPGGPHRAHPFREQRGAEMVSAVGVVGDGETGPLQVCSSVAASGSPVRAAGAPAPVAEADSIQPKGTRLLLVEVSAIYKPVAGTAFFKDGGASPSPARPCGPFATAGATPA